MADNAQKVANRIGEVNYLEGSKLLSSTENLSMLNGLLIKKSIPAKFSAPALTPC